MGNRTKQIIIKNTPVMKINVIFDNVVFSLQKIGGISAVWFELIKRIQNDGNFLCNFIEYDSAENNFYRKSICNINIIKLYLGKWLFLSRYVNPKLGINEPYIFHSSYYRTLRDKKAINVTTVHDFTYERSKKRDIATLVHIWQQKRAVMNSDIVVCISENTKRDLLHYYDNVDETKIHVVYNGVSEEYKILDNLDTINLPFKNGSYCIYVGVRRKYKNYKLAIESLVNTDYNIVLIGSPLNEDERHYLDDTLGSIRYFFFSNVSNERLNELYNGAFCLLYLSSYEGFGIPCVEAQKAGCPVIAYNASSIPEVVCEKELLCEVLTTDEVISKIRILEKEEKRKHIIENGVEFSKRFSWDKCFSELKMLYENAYEKVMDDWQSHEKNSTR